MTDNAIETITLTRAQMNAVLKAAYPLATEEERDTVLKSAMLSPSTLPIAGEGKVPDELLSLIPDEIDIPPMTDRGVAGQVLDVAWPLCGGNHQDADFWNIFSFAVSLTLRVSSPGKDGGQEAEAKPICHLVWRQGRRAIDDVEDYYEVARPGDKSVDGSDPFPVFAQPASTPLVERLTKALSAVNTWAEQRCPCRNEEPNPCPLCGADANKSGDICLSAENTFPRYLLTLIRDALSSARKDGHNANS